jgi:two-component system, NtrC family, nitrogen regulation response regulator NtrX
MITVNMGGLAETLFESELFGHVKGAFTDAKTDRAGRFELADESTLFMDEIANIPLTQQAKLLRVIETGDFERVGSSKTLHANVRIISATNSNLEDEVAAGRFRQDLLFRLNTIQIGLPPLRDRREDIPLLARHFMARASDAARLTPREFGEDAMAALQAYTWPGNVRQLRNVIDWLLIMAPGDTREPVRADMLPNDITAIAPTVVKWDKGSEIMTLPLRDAREVFEREYLLAQVTRFGGNISRTAAFVGMERSALHRKLKSLGVFGNDRPLKMGA